MANIFFRGAKIAFYVQKILKLAVNLAFVTNDKINKQTTFEKITFCTKPYLFGAVPRPIAQSLGQTQYAVGRLF